VWDYTFSSSAKVTIYPLLSKIENSVNFFIEFNRLVDIFDKEIGGYGMHIR